MSKRGRDHRGSTADPQHVQQFPEALPFPFAIGDDFPAMNYTTRRNKTKSVVHWGQRKLLLSEIELLLFYALKGQTSATPTIPYLIVYAGSAPGTHLAILDEWFPNLQWELVDPGEFDTKTLGNKPNFNLRVEFFTNATAYGIVSKRLTSAKRPGLAAVNGFLSLAASDQDEPERAPLQLGDRDVARTSTDNLPCVHQTPLTYPTGLELLMNVAVEAAPMLFICDIRSGSVAQDNFEEHVADNMKAQMVWTEIMQPTFSMLKFRLPYMEIIDPKTKAVVRRHESATTEYLAGDVVLPIWTRPTSTEARLVVPAGARRIQYDNKRYEDQFFFFNSVLRESVHFNHSVRGCELDHRYDGTAEVKILEQFVRYKEPECDPAQLSERVAYWSNEITAKLKGSFGGAVAVRDNVVLQIAREQGWEAMAKKQIAAAREERNRPVWWSNVDEGSIAGSESISGADPVWVCKWARVER